MVNPYGETSNQFIGSHAVFVVAFHKKGSVFYIPTAQIFYGNDQWLPCWVRAVFDSLGLGNLLRFGFRNSTWMRKHKKGIYIYDIYEQEDKKMIRSVICLFNRRTKKGSRM